MLARLVLITATAAGAASAQVADVDNGRNLFLYFCAECHGKDSASIGPLAEMLAIEPPELTGLTERNGGAFPCEAVAMQIDGRLPIKAHSYMPVFGTTLDDDQFVALALSSGQPMMVSQPMADLITYLQSIQAQPEQAE